MLGAFHDELSRSLEVLLRGKTKNLVSIVLYIPASRICLRPYVIYKATHIWDTWRIHGPKGDSFCLHK